MMNCSRIFLREPHDIVSISQFYYFLSFIFLILSTSMTNAADLEYSVDTYLIYGRTIEELRISIVKESSVLGNGAHGAASATFEFTPQVNYEETNDGCVLNDIRVRLVAAITLPEWASSIGADEKTVAAWRRFSRYVKAHEARHEAIAADYRRVMTRELEAIGAKKDCPALGREAVAVVADVERMHDEAQIAFDREERARSSLLGR